MSKVCQITGKKVITGNNVSHALNRTKRTFEPNLFDKRFFIPTTGEWIKLRVSKAGLRMIDMKGIEVAMKEATVKGFLTK
jgi:large subunit ribosomal protein L28|tara:strand:- start:2243 stop:2482 length:240 start_codon:yes stop_codon:yes gene_type:complete